MTRRPILFAMIMATLQAACASVPVERFYTLDALEPVVEPGGKNGIDVQRLAVGPVAVPDLLDRPQMVWRKGPQQVAIADQSRWAEPLSSAIGRVVADNLARQLPGVFAVSSQTDADIRIEIDIRRLEAAPGRSVTLEAVWTIRKQTGKKQGHALQHETVAGPAIEELIAAHERALHNLSRDIAAALREPRP